MAEISVIVPVYNVENFLEECLDSIVNQTFDDIEIICINDGSTDKSLDILNQYAQNDNRFTIVSQENAGHAVATNRGIKLAKGKYLYLMDSDDVLELIALEETYNFCEERDLDFVIFQAMNYVVDEDRYYKSEIYSLNKLYKLVEENIFNFNDLGEIIFDIPVTPWSKLYKTSFIKESGALFPEGLVFDDNVFFFEILFNAKRIAVLPKYLFTRRWYTYSSTTSGDKRFLDSIDINNITIDLFKEYGLFNQYKEQLYNRKINLGNFRFVHIKDEFKDLYFDKLKKDFENILSQDLYEDYKNNLNERNSAILDFVLESKTADEFKYKVLYYDTKNKNKNQEKLMDDLKNEINGLNSEVDDLKSNQKTVSKLKKLFFN